MVPCCGTLILPYLYLGDESDASDPEKLKSHNIYYVLNVTADLPGDGENDSIRYKRIPARDSFDQNLAQYFEESFQFIEEARQAGRAVLIHCHAGISRSPTIVVAYLMFSQKMNFDNAFKFVVNKRPKISPNFSFVGQLYEYEKTQIKPTLTPSTSTTTTPTTTTTPIPLNTLSSSLPPLLPTITISSSLPSLSSLCSSSSTSLTTTALISSTPTTTTTSTSNGTSTLPLLLLTTGATTTTTTTTTSTPPPTLSLISVKSVNSNEKTLLSPISLVTNTLSTTTITTSISAPTTPTTTSPIPLLLPTMTPVTPILTIPTTPTTTNRSYLKISDTLNKPFFLQPPPPPPPSLAPLNSVPSSHQLKDGLVKTDVLPSSCEALSDIPYNSLGPVRGCRSRKSCNNDFILLRPIKMTKNTRVK